MGIVCCYQCLRTQDTQATDGCVTFYPSASVCGVCMSTFNVCINCTVNGMCKLCSPQFATLDASTRNRYTVLYSDDGRGDGVVDPVHSGRRMVRVSPPRVMQPLVLEMTLWLRKIDAFARFSECIWCHRECNEFVSSVCVDAAHEGAACSDYCRDSALRFIARTAKARASLNMQWFTV